MAEEEKIEFSETVNNEVPEGAEYDVFSENSTEKEQPINREYLNQIFEGGIKLQHDTVTFTREMHGKMYLDIENHYETERKEKVKWITICQLAAVVSVGLALVPVFTIGFNGIVGLVLYLYRVFMMVFALCMEMCTVSYIKKFRKLKKEREKNIERLSQRKEEAMLSGTYDADF